jgi:hypothetical protein
MPVDRIKSAEAEQGHHGSRPKAAHNKQSAGSDSPMGSFGFQHFGKQQTYGDEKDVAGFSIDAPGIFEVAVYP